MNKDRAGPSSSSPAAFHPALVRKLLLKHLEEEEQQQQQRSDETWVLQIPPTLTTEAADAVGELMKLFVLEARNRAALDAEIEQGLSAEDGEAIQIRANNITKIAAEMLLDFS